MAEEMRSLYAIGGTDAAKIDATRARLRAREEREGGVASLQVFEASEGRGGPDHEAFLAAVADILRSGSDDGRAADRFARASDHSCDRVVERLLRLLTPA